MLLKEIREELVQLNQALPDNGLCTWTMGNASVRDPESGLVAIKPSGVKFPIVLPRKAARHPALGASASRSCV